MGYLTQMSRSTDPKLLADLFFSFAKISLFTVGGGPAMIPLVVDLGTNKRGWLSEEEMMDCLTISQSLPGGIIINMASYIGKKLCGTAGMLFAAFGAVIPSAVLAVVVAVFLGHLGDNVYATGAILGAKAAAVGLVLAAFIKLGAAANKTILAWVMTFAAMAAIIVFHVLVIWVIIAGGVIGWLAFKKKGSEV